MPIERDNGYLIDCDLQGRISVGIESTRVPDCVAEVLRRNATGVFGCPRFGFQGSDLTFLEELPMLRRVWFWDINLANIDGLYALEDLQYFGVHPKRPALDFSRFPKLIQVIWEPKLKDTGIASLPGLEVLHVWHFKPKHKTYRDLEIPTTITELELNWASPPSLEGLPLLPNLKRLEIHRCRNLESIAQLPIIAPNLEHLVVSSCGRVADGPEVVKHLPSIKHAFMRDKVLVTHSS